MRLLIVSHVTHFHRPDGLYAYEPYAREIEVWGSLFPSVVIAAPCRDEAPPSEASRIDSRNVTILPQTEAGGRSLGAKLRLLLATPGLAWSLARAMHRADAIHVRCPGNLGLLGALLAPLFSRRRIAKYAGQWLGFPGEEWTVRLQRAILRSRWWSAPVTVYGHHPGQPPHVIPFFTTVLSAGQVARGAAAASDKRFGGPLAVLYTGRLSASKNVDCLLRALARLHTQGVAAQAVIVGDGPERSSLETLCRELGLATSVTFTGWLSTEPIIGYLERSHVLVLASDTEGLGKSLIEGMAFGLVCVGSSVEALKDGRGVYVPPRDEMALAGALRRVAENPEEFDAMRAVALRYAHDFSLEHLRDELSTLMTRYWDLTEVPA